MEHIELSGKKYPIRFDFRALKEFKALTGNDVLKGFDTTDTNNLLALTYTGIKSGFYFSNPTAQECTISEEEISRLVSIKDMMNVTAAFMAEVKDLMPSDGVDNSGKPGEIPGTASAK